MLISILLSSSHALNHTSDLGAYMYGCCHTVTAYVIEVHVRPGVQILTLETCLLICKKNRGSTGLPRHRYQTRLLGWQWWCGSLCTLSSFPSFWVLSSTLRGQQSLRVFLELLTSCGTSTTITSPLSTGDCFCVFYSPCLLILQYPYQFS